jgi:hypothetical protein
LAGNFFDSYFDLERLGYITKERFLLIWNSSYLGKLYQKKFGSRIEETFFPREIPKIDPGKISLDPTHDFKITMDCDSMDHYLYKRDFIKMFESLS